MTTEEKAKAYDEALERASHIKDNNIVATPQEVAEHIFPELHEDEDEKIRQQLLWLCDEWEHNPDRRTIPADIDNIKQIRRYLEKQKEFFKHGYGLYYYHNGGFTFVARPAEEEEKQKESLKYFIDNFPYSDEKKDHHIPWYDYQKSKEAGYTIVPNEEYEQLIKQKEQNPIWSEEDETIIEGACATLENYGHTKLASMLKSLRPQPKQEWSEEDDWKRKELIQYLEEKGDYRTVWMTWLKSLSPPPHKEIYQAAKRDLAIKFMNYLDENRPEGKMSLSNGECEDIDKAFKENDWAKIMRYYEKYQPHWKPSEELDEEI